MRPDRGQCMHGDTEGCAEDAIKVTPRCKQTVDGHTVVDYLVLNKGRAPEHWGLICAEAGTHLVSSSAANLGLDSAGKLEPPQLISPCDGAAALLQASPGCLKFFLFQSKATLQRKPIQLLLLTIS